MVYERNVEVGGLLRYGIPTMKLGKDVRPHLSAISLSVCLSVCLSVKSTHYTDYVTQGAISLIP